MKLPITVEPSTVRTVLETEYALAERYGLSAGDAKYLDLALRRNLPLATNDQPLRAAAKKAA